MIDGLSQRLQAISAKLRGQGRLTEDNMRETLREVRMALLEADVALPVVKNFIERVRNRAQGQDVLASLTPGQVLVKVVQDELVEVMRHDGGSEAPRRIDAAVPLEMSVRPPAVILLAGLQGSGKTTTAAKIARLIKEKLKKSVMLASVDVYRPAAIEQLQKLSATVGAKFFPANPGEKPAALAAQALAAARNQVIDVLILDTAGRLHVDEAMMEELKAIHAAVSPIETLFVVDATVGQDAVNTAKSFNEALALTGVVLTKADGDARGGAALSVRQVTGRPIKFLGVGEATEALEVFDAQRVAARILGMGDIVGLVERAQGLADREKLEATARKLQKGKGFDLEDFRDQMLQMQKMGGIASLLEMLPGVGAVPEAARANMNDGQTKRLIAIINSMTPQERRRPDIIRASRKRRIAAGSGTQVQDVNRLLKQFDQSQQMLKRFGKGGIARMMQEMKGRFPGTN